MVCGLQRIGLLPCQGRHARFDEVEFFFAATGRSRAEPLQPEADLTSGTKSALKTKKAPARFTSSRGLRLSAANSFDLIGWYLSEPVGL